LFAPPPNEQNILTATDATVTVQFDEEAANDRLKTLGFTLQNNTGMLANLGDTSIENGYGSINLHYALSSGLRGTDKTLALVSDAFRPTHDVFNDTTLNFYKNQSGPSGTQGFPSFGILLRSSGTALAGILSGTPTEDFVHKPGSIFSIAEGADLHLTATSGAGFENSDLSKAVADAAANGALVQALAIELTDKDTGAPVTLEGIQSFNSGNPNATFAQKLEALTGFSRTDLSALVAAMAATGDRMVFATHVSDDPDAESSSFLPALPSLYSALEGKVIAVASAQASHENGEIEELTLFSSRCLETAAYCILADGYRMASALDSEDDTYRALQYSSAAYAMVQVAGSFALLSEAFPDIPSTEILARILATADNSFFVDDPDIEKFQSTFGIDGSYEHAYSREYGHGLLDLRAALSPIGPLGIAISSNIADGSIPMADIRVSTSSTFGKSIANGLSGVQMVLFDSLGTPFFFDASNILAPDQSADKSQASTQISSQSLAQLSYATETGSKRVMGYGFRGEHSSGFSAGALDVPGFTGLRFLSGDVRQVANAVGAFHYSDALFTGTGSILPTQGNTQGFGLSHTQAGNGQGVYSFVEQDGEGIESFGFSAFHTWLHGDLGFSKLALVAKSEPTSFLGSSLSGNTQMDLEAASTALRYSTFLRLSEDEESLYSSLENDGTFLFATAELGLSQAKGAGLIESFDTTRFSGFSAGLQFNSVFSDTDDLVVSLRQPLRIEGGNANFRLPVGRDLEGNVRFTDLPVSLEPEARQIDLGVLYGINPTPATRVNLGAVWSLNEGHIAGNTSQQILATLRHKF